MTTQSIVEVVVDEAQVDAALTHIEAQLTEVALGGFLDDTVVPWLRARAEMRFTNEGDSASGKWAPLRDATMRIRESGTQMGLWNVGPDHPINVRTHELEDYITQGTGDTVPNASGVTLTYPGQRGLSAEIRDKVMTAQMGSVEPRTVPRPVLAVDGQDMEFVLSRLQTHILGGMSL